MFIKNKKIRNFIVMVFAMVAAYSGISCIATFHKATIQPYLLEGEVEYHFLGYYMMAALAGSICFILTIATAHIIKQTKNKNRK